MDTKLIYSLKVFKGKRKKEINYDKLSNILDELSDENDAVCRGLNDDGNFDNSINPEEHGHIDLIEISTKFPDLTFELICINNDLNIIKTIYKNGKKDYIDGKITFS